MAAATFQQGLAANRMAGAVTIAAGRTAGRDVVEASMAHQMHRGRSGTLACRPHRFPPHPDRTLDCLAPRLSRRPVPHGGGGRASRELPAGAPAAAPAIRPAGDSGCRQGRRLHGRGRRALLSRRAGHAGAPDSTGSRSPVAATAGRRAAYESSRRATRCPMPPGLPPTSETLELADAAGADDLVLVLISGGASANWIAPAAGPFARGQAVGDARAARFGRLDRRDQYAAQASLAHQGRTARAARASRAARRGGNFRRARR